MNDSVLDDMWNPDQCRDYPYRSNRNQVSGWLNNFWMRIRLIGIPSSAPWTWNPGHPWRS